MLLFSVIILIFIGAIILGFAVIKSQSVIELLQPYPEYVILWQRLCQAILFFLIGYLLTIGVIWWQQNQILTLVIGSVYLSGAIFVLFVVQVGLQTINNITAIITKLQQTQQSLQQHRDQLQQTVAQRTETIEIANNYLQQKIIEQENTQQEILVISQIAQQIDYALLNKTLHIQSYSPKFSQWVALEPQPTTLTNILITDMFMELIGMEEILNQLFEADSEPFFLPKIHRTTIDDELGYFFNLSIERLNSTQPYLLVLITDVTTQAHLEHRLRQESNELRLNIIQRQQAEAEAQKQRQIAEGLRKVTMTLNRSLDQTRVLQAILTQLNQIIPYDSIGVFLRDENNNDLIMVSGKGLDASHLGKHIPLTGANPTIIPTFQEGKPRVIDDVYEDLHWELRVNGERIRGWMGVPLLISDKPIGVLTVESLTAKAYKENEAQILQAFANQAAVAIQNAKLFAKMETAHQQVQQLNDRLQHELTMAHKIQQSLLPPDKPDWPELDIACYNLPARAVGGDFFTYEILHNTSTKRKRHRFTSKHFALAVGDVSGKGMPAALLMAVSLVSFKTQLQKISTTNRQVVDLISDTAILAKFMADLDQSIAYYTGTTRQNCAMVFAEIVLDGDVIQLHTVNAGCIPPYIKYSSGVVEELDIGGFALGQGLGAQLGYEQLTRTISVGDAVILVSDGVVEANNQNGEMLGFERLEEIIQTAPTTNATDILEHIKQATFAFTDEAEQHDDITIIVTKL